MILHRQVNFMRGHEKGISINMCLSVVSLSTSLSTFRLHTWHISGHLPWECCLMCRLWTSFFGWEWVQGSAFQERMIVMRWEQLKESESWKVPFDAKWIPGAENTQALEITGWNTAATLLRSLLGEPVLAPASSCGCVPWLATASSLCLCPHPISSSCLCVSFMRPSYKDTRDCIYGPSRKSRISSSFPEPWLCPFPYKVIVTGFRDSGVHGPLGRGPIQLLQTLPVNNVLLCDCPAVFISLCRLYALLN